MMKNKRKTNMKLMKAYRQNKGWRMIHARLCEVARQPVFSASPRHFFDCESETSKHFSASARSSAKRELERACAAF